MLLYDFDWQASTFGISFSIKELKKKNSSLTFHLNRECENWLVKQKKISHCFKLYTNSKKTNNQKKKKIKENQFLSITFSILHTPK